ncbi:MAG TPA: acetyl-CoA carboxylase biotin carboxyl carrier protein [Acidobacteriota bacterium]|nr:acetyl-CoA carboxylase biotin carboxyl carrier protein [Acidobacteriota bacterium]
MDLKEIRDLLELIDDTTAIEEFEMEQGDLRIRIRKASARTNDASPAPTETVSASGSSLAVTAPPPAPAESIHIFKAPIVGTFYITPKPDAEPFVRAGEPVHKGMVICIIEAMKLFNQIESDVDGTIMRVLVENGQPVEYGEPLFEIRLNS